MFNKQTKEPFCQCLQDIDNELPHNQRKHCLTPCEYQQKIADKRKENLALADLLVKDLEVAIEQNHPGIIPAGGKNLTAKELLAEIKNMTPIGRKYVEAHLRGEAYIKKQKGS